MTEEVQSVISEHVLKKVIAESSKEDILSAVEHVVGKSTKKFKQDIVGENEETLDRTLRQYRAKVARHSWKASQKWCKWDEDGPVLMPDFTRLYYRKGNTEIVILEHPPKVRLVKFRGSLVTRNSTSENIPVGEHDKIHTFSLALPYVVFIFRFSSGSFQEVRCAFCDRPMKRLEERPLRPYLSNIDTNLSVCLGTGFDRSKLVKDDIFQQVSFVMSHFWHTAYSDEWATHFWATKSHFLNTANDDRMSGMASWEEASEENPLFVVEDVNWLKHNEENFGDMIVRMFDGDMKNTSLHEDLYKELVDNFLDEVKTTYQTNLNNVEERFTSDPEKLAQELVDFLSPVDPA